MYIDAVGTLQHFFIFQHRLTLNGQRYQEVQLYIDMMIFEKYHVCLQPHRRKRKCVIPSKNALNTSAMQSLENSQGSAVGGSPDV